MSDWLSPAEWQAVALSLKVASVATLVSLPIALLAAYSFARWKFRGWQVLNLLVHLPLILPPVVTGYVLLLGFGSQGPLGRLFSVFGLNFAFHWTGAALAAGIMAFPLTVRAMRLSIEAVDYRLEEAAATLGVSPARVFFRVTFPLILPGILAGMVLGFAKAIGEFGATITFVAAIPGQTRTLPSSIYLALQVPGGEGMALRLTVISVIIAVGALLVSELLARRVAGRIGQS